MTTKLRRPDGTVHYSDLKRIAQSPAHYKYGIANPLEQTRSMRMGSAVHAFVLGQREDHPVTLFEGERRGNAWKQFAQENAHATILTTTEWEEAQRIANAVLADPIAGRLVREGRKEVPVKWTMDDVECSTGGIDLLGGDWLADLKMTQSAEPAKFMKLALNLAYPQQLAMYKAAAASMGTATKKHYIIGVESRAPYPVTVLNVTDDLMAFGYLSVSKWLERLRVCDESDFWPGYTQTLVDFELPDWLDTSTDEEDTDEEEELS